MNRRPRHPNPDVDEVLRYNTPVLPPPPKVRGTPPNWPPRPVPIGPSHNPILGYVVGSLVGLFLGVFFVLWFIAITR